MLPNFYIVGTPKSGTTSLYHYLKEHPEVFMSPQKEPNFFSHEDITKQKLYYPVKNIDSIENYKALFDNVSKETVIGEASVSYLFYEKTPGKIKYITPDSKLIIILRNPIDRAFSHFLMDHRLGLINYNISFEDIVYKKSNHPMINLYYQQFIELGFYYAQIKRYCDTFGLEKIKIFLTEDLKTNLENVLKEVCRFLNIDDSFNFDIEQRHNVYRTPRNNIVKFLYSFKKMRSLTRSIIPNHWVSNVKNQLLLSDKKPDLSIKTKKYLDNLYLDDIKKTANLIQRDLSIWCSKEYLNQ